MKVLVTGGAGYIGSTISSALIDRGHIPIIIDSLVNGRKEFVKGRFFYQGDIADRELLTRIFRDHPNIDVTIHLAGFLSVPESEAKPYEYYDNNVSKSNILFKTLSELGCKRIIFSSTASVYGNAGGGSEVFESMNVFPESTYGKNKFMIEQILQDFCKAYSIRGISLRYFNLIGADPKMRSGAYAKNPSHLLGALITALDTNTSFYITGVDWPTRDGTGIRDYIHVWDLALAHIKAAEEFDLAFEKSEEDDKGFMVINLGTNTGVTVKEFVTAFEKVTGRSVLKKEVPPRPGDVAGAYANADKAKELIGWQTELSLEQGIVDALKWYDHFSENYPD